MRQPAFRVAASILSPAVLSAQPAPTPRTTFDGPAVAFDWPALRIGVAEYDAGPTGATVFYFPNGVAGAVDARGGAPGTVNTDAMRLGYDWREFQAVVFAGGSWNGLAAATGVANEIRALGTTTDRAPPIPGVV